jgi:membrane fusion protein, adhesin transport system
MSDSVEVRPLSAPHPDSDRGPRRTVAAMVGLTLLFLATAIVWAIVADLDVAVQARGVVVAPSRLQEVQSLEGGIVEELFVSAGQTVKKGQRLARLDTAQYTANLGESRQQQLAALVSRARVEALLTGTAPRFEDSWRQEVPERVEKETQLWRDASREHQANLQVAAQAIQRRRGEQAEALARITALKSAVRVGEESFAIEERLFKEGAGARADYLAAQQRLLSQKAELDALQQSLPRLAAALAEAQAQATETESRARAQWGVQRSEFETRAAALSSALGGQQDKVTRRDLLSPVDGVVNRVLVNTLGGVAVAGRPIIEIVPADARLQLTARVRPADIGFIRVGQSAHASVLAYDPSTYGKLDAVVERVGADAIPDDKGEPYFEIQLTAARDQLKLHGKPLAITPGMPLDVGVLTGQRSVMQYLLKPVLRSLQGALQER